MDSLAHNEKKDGVLLKFPVYFVILFCIEMRSPACASRFQSAHRAGIPGACPFQ